VAPLYRSRLVLRLRKSAGPERRERDERENGGAGAESVSRGKGFHGAGSARAFATDSMDSRPERAGEMCGKSPPGSSAESGLCWVLDGARG
jgi:hypothetical protein